MWFHLVEKLMSVNLSDEPDTLRWKITQSGMFLVKSYYAELMNDNTRYLRKYLWKLKVPLKIWIFLVHEQKRIID